MDKPLSTLLPTKQWIAFHRQHFIIWECTSWKIYRYFPILFHCCKDIMIRRPRRIITCAKENSCLRPKQAPQRQALSLTLDLKSARILPLPVENERERTNSSPVCLFSLRFCQLSTSYWVPRCMTASSKYVATP